MRSRPSGLHAALRRQPPNPARRTKAKSSQPPLVGCYQGITFDVGGTLLEPWPSVGHAYAEVAARHGLHGISPSILNRRFTRAWRALKNFHHRRAEWAGLVDETFRGLAEPLPSKTFFRELYDHFAKPAAWRIFDDVLPTLNALSSKGIKLGIISNWDDRLRPLLRRLELQRFFQAIIVSCDTGHPKPSPVMFRQAARMLGLKPGAILHVGDSLVMDVQGARAAGFGAVHLRRGARAAKGSIHSLAELLVLSP